MPDPREIKLGLRVQIPHPRDISVVQKKANSPTLSRKGIGLSKRELNIKKL